MMTNVRVLLLVIAGVSSVNGQGSIPGIADICFEPAEPGICRAYIPSFYFNPLSGSCDCFVYGGCMGNSNRFSTLQECMDTCSVRQSLQFNTPACERIFGADNPLANIMFSPHQPGTKAIPNPAPTETQPTETEISASPTEESEGPTVPSVATPAETEESSHSAAEEEEEGGESPTSTKGISSLIHGSNGISHGFLKIGQPVFISLGNSKSRNEEEPQ